MTDKALILLTASLLVGGAFVSLTTAEAQWANQPENSVLPALQQQDTSDQIRINKTKQDALSSPAQTSPSSTEAASHKFSADPTAKAGSKPTVHPPAVNASRQSLPKENAVDKDNSTNLQQIITTNSQTLQLVTILVGVITLRVGFLQWKTNETLNKEIDAAKSKIDAAKNDISNNVAGIVYKQIENALPYKIHNAMESDLEARFKHLAKQYEDHLRKVTAEITGSVEQRFYLAQLVRSDLWSQRMSEVTEPADGGAPSTIQLLEANAHQEADGVALAQLLSSDNKQLFTGLGALGGRPDPLPSSLLGLLQLLEWDHRLTDPDCNHAARELARRLGGGLQPENPAKS